MSITPQEIQQALRVSRAIQEYIEMTSSQDLRSTDVFPYLARKGLFERDARHNGKYFRRFLRKLHKANMLKSLVPQCRYLEGVNDQLMGEWYFNSVVEDKPNSKSTFTKESRKIASEPMTAVLALETIQSLLNGVHPITNRDLSKEDVCMEPRVQEALAFIIAPETQNDEDQVPTERTSHPQTNSYDLSKNQSLEKMSKELDARVEKYFNAWQEEVESWGIKKSGDQLIPQIIEKRKSYPRAYEDWSDRERVIFREAWELTNDKAKIARLLKRNQGSISAALKKLEANVL